MSVIKSLKKPFVLLFMEQLMTVLTAKYPMKHHTHIGITSIKGY